MDKDTMIIALKEKMGENIIVLYHGSDTIVNPPIYGKGELANDYGRGFYMTEYPELAAEWACRSRKSSGIVNKYILNLDGLNILDMDKEPLEHWISVLVQNRDNDLGTAARERSDRFVLRYPFSVAVYDVVKGWRADDSYYAFVRAFFNLGLSFENLRTAMRFGEYGTQYCLLSEKSFNKIEYVTHSKIDTATYYEKRRSRDVKAKNLYMDMKDKDKGTLLIDLIGR